MKVQWFFFAMGHFDWHFKKNHDIFNTPQIEACSTNMGLNVACKYLMLKYNFFKFMVERVKHD